MYYLFLKKPSIEYSLFAAESRKFEGIVLRESRNIRVVDLAKLSGTVVFEVADDFYLHLTLAVPSIKSFVSETTIEDWCSSYLNPLKEKLDKVISPCNNKLNK